MVEPKAFWRNVVFSPTDFRNGRLPAATDVIFSFSDNNETAATDPESQPYFPFKFWALLIPGQIGSLRF